MSNYNTLLCPFKQVKLVACGQQPAHDSAQHTVTLAKPVWLQLVIVVRIVIRQLSAAVPAAVLFLHVLVDEVGVHLRATVEAPVGVAARHGARDVVAAAALFGDGAAPRARLEAVGGRGVLAPCRLGRLGLAVGTLPVDDVGRRALRADALGKRLGQAAVVAPGVDPGAGAGDGGAQVAEGVEAEARDDGGRGPAATKGAVQGGNVEQAAAGVEAVPVAVAAGADALAAAAAPAGGAQAALAGGRKAEAAGVGLGAAGGDPAAQLGDDVVDVADGLAVEGQRQGAVAFGVLGRWRREHLDGGGEALDTGGRDGVKEAAAAKRLENLTAGGDVDDGRDGAGGAGGALKRLGAEAGRAVGGGPDDAAQAGAALDKGRLGHGRGVVGLGAGGAAVVALGPHGQAVRVRGGGGVGGGDVGGDARVVDGRSGTGAGGLVAQAADALGGHDGDGAGEVADAADDGGAHGDLGLVGLPADAGREGGVQVDFGQLVVDEGLEEGAVGAAEEAGGAVRRRSGACGPPGDIVLVGGQQQVEAVGVPGLRDIERVPVGRKGQQLAVGDVAQRRQAHAQGQGGQQGGRARAQQGARHNGVQQDLPELALVLGAGEGERDAGDIAGVAGAGGHGGNVARQVVFGGDIGQASQDASEAAQDPGVAGAANFEQVAAGEADRGVVVVVRFVFVAVGVTTRRRQLGKVHGRVEQHTGELVGGRHAGDELEDLGLVVVRLLEPLLEAGLLVGVGGGVDLAAELGQQVVAGRVEAVAADGAPEAAKDGVDGDGGNVGLDDILQVGDDEAAVGLVGAVALAEVGQGGLAGGDMLLEVGEADADLFQVVAGPLADIGGVLVHPVLLGFGVPLAGQLVEVHGVAVAAVLGQVRRTAVLGAARLLLLDAHPGQQDAHGDLRDGGRTAAAGNLEARAAGPGREVGEGGEGVDVVALDDAEDARLLAAGAQRAGERDPVGKRRSLGPVQRRGGGGLAGERVRLAYAVDAAGGGRVRRGIGEDDDDGADVVAHVGVHAGQARLGGLGPVAAVAGLQVPRKVEQLRAGGLGVGRDVVQVGAGVEAVPAGTLGEGAAAVVAVGDDADAGEAACEGGDADDLGQRVVEGVQVDAHGRRGVGDDAQVVDARVLHGGGGGMGWGFENKEKKRKWRTKGTATSALSIVVVKRHLGKAHCDLDRASARGKAVHDHHGA
ncbi:uncharacterized protein SPSK_04843 [Sporothrix schenckii 1099-18]|uniref:Uncharacterized protein n=1 Tax=Sporothrix schenckii 1099-18 TaxID=1397361 RepID=A0A0F2LS05_SPOSC|nr:uncharacterized protein SPSK_04843 [Sporothrix schenckii 1099-18]KJR80287.1 hypothetical protein SPSK_04843 [Sporothrix schenckii 1099-18]